MNQGHTPVKEIWSPMSVPTSKGHIDLADGPADAHAMGRVLDQFSYAWPRAVLVGSVSGVIVSLVMMVPAMAEDMRGFEMLGELLLLPVLILIYGALTMPFTGIGLLLFGLPAALLLQPVIMQRWTAILVVVWAAVAGRLMYFGVDHLMFFGTYELLHARLNDPATNWSVPTGLAFWSFLRRNRVPA